jgi:hypothetical protein
LSDDGAQGFYSIVNVQPVNENAAWIGDVAGAFVFTMGIAASEEHFKELVAAEFHNDGFAVIEWEKITPFDLATTVFEAENARLLREHLCMENPVQYARFDSYPREGLDA